MQELQALGAEEKFANRLVDHLNPGADCARFFQVHNFKKASGNVVDALLEAF